MTIFKNNFGLLGLPNLGVTGINPNAQMPNMGLQQQLPSGGMGGQPTILNQMPTMYNAPQPMSFADRLRNIGQRMFDYGVGYNKAGGYSFDPSAGDPKLPHTLGFENMQNQALNRAKLANTLQQQQFNNQIALKNQMTKDQKNFAYRESLPDDQKANFDSFIKSSGLSGVPSAIQKYQHLQNIRKVHGENSRQEKDFMNVIRGSTTANIGGQLYQIDGFGNIINKIDKTLSPENQPPNIIEQEQAKVTGKAYGELKLQFPTIQAEMKDKIQLIDDMLADPKLGSYLGKKALLTPDILVAGSRQGDFRKKLEQLKGKEFLTQFDKLKGGGVISDKEGEQALKAGTTISLALSEEGLREELLRLRNIAEQVTLRKMTQMDTLGNQSQPSPTNEIIEVTDEDL
jgi:hypothetical protein